MSPNVQQQPATMSDGARIHWSLTGDTNRRPAAVPVVILNGGPGLPNDLDDLAAMLSDLAPVYRYDQRGTGESPWQGQHTLARHSAERRRPVNWSMNRELGAENKADPLDDHLDALRACLPPRREIIGGSRDPRPLQALVTLGKRLGAPVTTIADAGHEPWLEQPEAVRAAMRAFLRR